MLNLKLDNFKLFIFNIICIVDILSFFGIEEYLFIGYLNDIKYVVFFDSNDFFWFCFVKLYFKIFVLIYVKFLCVIYIINC